MLRATEKSWRMLNAFHVLRTNWKEPVDFKERNGWLQLTTSIGFVSLNLRIPILNKSNILFLYKNVVFPA